MSARRARTFRHILHLAGAGPDEEENPYLPGENGCAPSPRPFFGPETASTPTSSWTSDEPKKKSG